MRKLLNTLYVITPENYISREGDDVIVRNKQNEIGRYPANVLENIVLFSYASVTSQVIDLCVNKNIHLSIMSSNGRFIGSIYGPIKGNVLLRRSQYRMADDNDISAYLSRQFIQSKIHNSIIILQNGLSDNKDRIDSEFIRSVISLLKNSLEKVSVENDIGSIRGIEGDAAKSYFKAIDELILVDKDNFYMKSRNRRPPTDRFNALLSFFYTLLTTDVCCALETVGLDPYVGFIHTDRPGRPSLALDMMEELRPFVDRLVLSMINLKKINCDDFIENDVGSFKLTDNSRKIVLNEWQSKNGV